MLSCESPGRQNKLAQVNPWTQSLIDMILTNKSELLGDCGVCNPEISDYTLVYGFIKEKVKPKTERIIKF